MWYLVSLTSQSTSSSSRWCNALIGCSAARISLMNVVFPRWISRRPCPIAMVLPIGQYRHSLGEKPSKNSPYFMEMITTVKDASCAKPGNLTACVCITTIMINTINHGLLLQSSVIGRRAIYWLIARWLRHSIRCMRLDASYEACMLSICLVTTCDSSNEQTQQKSVGVCINSLTFLLCRVASNVCFQD